MVRIPLSGRRSSIFSKSLEVAVRISSSEYPLCFNFLLCLLIPSIKQTTPTRSNTETKRVVISGIQSPNLLVNSHSLFLTFPPYLRHFYFLRICILQHNSELQLLLLQCCLIYSSRMQVYLFQFYSTEVRSIGLRTLFLYKSHTQI